MTMDSLLKGLKITIGMTKSHDDLSDLVQRSGSIDGIFG